MKNKKGLKILSTTMAMALILGGTLVYNNNLKSHANTANNATTNQEEASNDIIKQFRKDDTTITITSIDDLYTSLDTSNINIEDALATSSDEVINEYFKNELTNLNEALQNIDINKPSSSVYLNNDSYYGDVTIENYQRKNSDTKTVTQVNSKYGLSYTSTTINESKKTNRKKDTGNWFKVDDETFDSFKDNYGACAVLNDNSCKIGPITICDFSIRFDYSASPFGLTAQNIKCNNFCIAEGIVHAEIESEKINDRVASKEGHNIDATVKLAIKNITGIGTIHVKKNVIITLKKNDSTKCQVTVQPRMTVWADVRL